MTFQPITTTVKSGKIMLDVDWPEGITVRVEPIKEERPTFWDVLDKYDGMATDLPEDLAENLDHYLHGHSKK